MNKKIEEEIDVSYVESKRKSNKVLYIVIICLVIILLIFGFLFWKSNLVNNNLISNSKNSSEQTILKYTDMFQM